MVPVLWETGGDISRTSPYTPSPALRQVLPLVSASTGVRSALGTRP
jgi:hypothetical protein